MAYTVTIRRTLTRTFRVEDGQSKAEVRRTVESYGVQEFFSDEKSITDDDAIRIVSIDYV